MTAVIVTVGIAVNSQITSRTSSARARVENVQYPIVEALRAMRSDVVENALSTHPPLADHTDYATGSPSRFARPDL